MTWEIALGVGALAVSAVGVGMSYSASQTSAANQAAMARYNYAVQAQNIRQQEAIAQQQANYQASYQQANAAIASQTANANALAYQQEADATLSQGVEQQRRTREEQLRFQALQRAGIAKSGVAGGVGTPVEVLAESAKLSQLALNDAWYETNLERDRYNRAAEMERYGGSIDSANYGMQAALTRNEGALAPIRARMQMREAAMGKLAGLNQASGIRSAGTANAVSGFGTVLSMGYDFGQQNNWFKSTKKTG